MCTVNVMLLLQFVMFAFIELYTTCTVIILLRCHGGFTLQQCSWAMGSPSDDVMHSHPLKLTGLRPAESDDG